MNLRFYNKWLDGNITVVLEPGFIIKIIFLLKIRRESYEFK